MNISKDLPRSFSSIQIFLGSLMCNVPLAVRLLYWEQSAASPKANGSSSIHTMHKKYQP